MSAKTILVIVLLLIVPLICGCADDAPGAAEPTMASKTAAVSPGGGTAVQNPNTAITGGIQPAGEMVAPDAEKRLNVPLLYSGYNEDAALCYLGAYGMAAMYQDPTLDFSDIVAASGAGTGARYWGGDFVSNGVDETALIYASENLGYLYNFGLGAGGVDSDYDLPHEYRIRDRASQVSSFRDKGEALTFLQSAVTAGYPVAVHLDMYYLRDAFAPQDPYWMSLPKMHNSHYMTVTGYDAENIYLNDPTSTGGKDLSIPSAAFLDAWAGTATLSSANLGPYWGIYPVKTGTVKSFSEILTFNRKSDAPSEIQRFAESGTFSDLSYFMFNEIARGRNDFADYLADNGRNDAAAKYRELSTQYGSVKTSSDQRATLLAIASLEDEALGML